MLDSKLNEEDFEEAHYNHVLEDFVELIVVYGYKQVVTDLGAKLEAKTW